MTMFCHHLTFFVVGAPSLGVLVFIIIIIIIIIMFSYIRSLEWHCYS